MRTTVTLSVDTRDLTLLTQVYTQVELAEQLQAAVDAKMQQLISVQMFDGYTRISRDDDAIRMFRDQQGHHWCCWFDVCHVAQISNPSVEGVHRADRRRIKVPSKLSRDGKLLQVAKVEDVVLSLQHRQTRREHAEQAIALIKQTLTRTTQQLT